MSLSSKNGNVGSQLPNQPFVSDGCSGGLSKWWKKLFGCKPPIHRSCYYHDMEYHWGAGPNATPLDNFIQRLGTDLRFGWGCFVNDGLMKIVDAMLVDSFGSALVTWKDRLRYATLGLISMALAPLVFTAVRLGGGSYWPTTYRWAYGRTK